MKKILSLLLVTVLLLSVGCAKTSTSATSDTIETTDTSATATTDTSAADTTAATDTTTSTEKVFTAEELAKFDGLNGNAAYVAVDGVVYDVTNDKQWPNGEHQGKYKAGQDLTSEIGQSPHGKKVLENLPIVGKLQG